MFPVRFWRMGRTEDFASERERMIDRQLRRRGIADEAILDAFRAVPREAFVAERMRHLAYGDHPLPIEADQTISQPYIVALMVEAARLGLDDKVLEVGAGSGYAAAVMSHLAARVITIERQHELAVIARERLQELGYSNIAVVEGDGTKGCVEEAPFDAILAAASGSHVPQSLLDQLAPKGRLVMPLGGAGLVQKLIRVTK
ncbi:MAG TPA: protein-L-isoaspartate(D-aspartate) O-methyltransferase, partial [Sphingomicrobium sp.]|nr:protein-L-isoaspartate(D-aspartate) O-methyltransferase [Sphingomicrobium sp.]